MFLAVAVPLLAVAVAAAAAVPLETFVDGAGGVGGYAPCMPGMTCFQLQPYKHSAAYGNWSSFVFDCAAVNSTRAGPSRGQVLFMHGNDGPRAKGMWALMMTAAAAAGYDTLACDQRGFSPGASPNASAYYNYNYLSVDIFALVDAYFFPGGGSSINNNKFHLVAHDQGARVGWHTIALGPGRERFLSFTPMSEAHSDVFSDALFGDHVYPAQQTHFMYLWQFTLPGMSTLAYQENIWHVVCSDAYKYKTPQACQPAMWWYSGAIASGNLAMQPLGAFGSIGKEVGIPLSYVKAHTTYPLSGQPQRVKVGMVQDLPILYICGASDYADICNNHFRDGTAARVKDFSYLELSRCGHNLVDPSKCPQYQTVIDKVVAALEAAA